MGEPRRRVVGRGRPRRTHEVVVVTLEHWQFLFLLTALAGLYVLHALSRVQEDGETSERQVIQQFAIEAANVVGNLPSIGGAIGGLFAFRRLSERRRAVRARQMARRRDTLDAPP
jgi:hypothetical protein